MNTSLYEISKDYNEALATLTDLDDEAVQDTLDALKDTLEVKATNVAKYIGNLEASTVAMKQAEQKIAKRRKVIENRMANIKQYLKVNMEKNNIHRIEAPEFVIKIAKNPPKVVIDDGVLIPEKFKYEVSEIKINKKMIKDKLIEGDSVSGAKLEQSTRLEIK